MPKRPKSAENSKVPRLFELIDSQKLSDKEFSQQTDIPTSNIGAWRSGTSAPTIDYLIIIANYFDVTIDFLVGRSNKAFSVTAPVLSALEQRLLTAFNSLPDLEKGELLGRAEHLAEINTKIKAKEA